MALGFNSGILALLSLLIIPQQGEARALSPAEVLQLTYASSLAAKIRQLDPEMARAELNGARSQYDLGVKGGLSYTKDKTERASTIFGTDSSLVTTYAGASQLAPSGTAVDLTFADTRESSNSTFMTMDPVYESKITLAVTQPLLKNYFGFATRGQIGFAEARLETVREETEAKLHELAYQNLSLYLRWYLEVYRVRLQRDAVTLARKNLDTNKEKLGMGLVERSDLYAFAANLDAQEHTLLAIEEAVIGFRDELAYSLSLELKEKLSPASAGVTFGRLENLQSMSAEGLNYHPVLRAIRKDLKSQDIAVAIAKNGKLPQLDFIASLGLNGLDGDGGTAITEVANGHPIWTTGLTVTFPLQNRKARAEEQKSAILKRQKLLALQDAENKIMALIRKSYERYRTANRRLGVASSMVEHQRLKWEAEITRYNQARSSPDTVIRYQDDYLNARKVQLETQVAVEFAKLELWYAVGRLREPG